MSSMEMMVKQQEATAEWKNFFPNGLKSKQESLLFVKRMMAVTVSYITYLRGIFPEEAYRSKYLEDICLKILRENCKTMAANKMVKWMMGCFDALEKQYLQVVYIGVYTNPDEPDCIIESYLLKIRYSAQGPELNVVRKDGAEMQVTMGETKKASVVLIRKLLLLMQNLNPLPDNVYLNMKLYYYDDITPVDYQPPGFQEAQCDSLWFEGHAVHFKVGKVQTAFHCFSVDVLAEQGRVEKLQTGTQKRDGGGISPNGDTMKDPSGKIPDDKDLPSEDESAQFKKPRTCVRKAPGKTLRKKRL
ncbi:zebrafish testis-expressed 38 [Salarias fasciatus]|uniref:zebrafish testis-expressed 38 n=1 Tax=Salarias fasciatus TaxID=181472 RepID=UPI0011767C1A|nr:HORMA domain-containing protein 1-like [Salarias fasciatus]